MNKNIVGIYSTYKLKDFYLEHGKNPFGMELTDIWEKVKLFEEEDMIQNQFDEAIQWMFPLCRKNIIGTWFLYSPILSMKQVKRLRREKRMKGRMIISLMFVLEKYGLKLDVMEGEKIVIIYNADECQTYNRPQQKDRHLHYARIYRILKSLRLFGLDGFADALKSVLKDRSMKV